MITWHTIPRLGGLRSVAYCRVGSTVLRRTTCDGEPTGWDRALVHADGDGLQEWLARIEEHEWATIDRDEAGRLLGTVTAKTITDEQIRELRFNGEESEGGHVDAHLALHSRFAAQRVHLRERCAAIYNARLGWLP